MAHSFRTGPEQQGINLCPRQPVLLPRPRRLAWQIVDGLTQSDALALYRQIVADGWRFPALALTFEQSGHGRSSQARPGHSQERGRRRCRMGHPASGLINLVLGDAYLEAALVLLCHKLARWQQGQRGKRRAMLRASLMRMVAIDALMWRSARIGGSEWSVTRG
jgi:hypothetical protein